MRGLVGRHVASESIHPAYRDEWAGREAEVVFGNGGVAEQGVVGSGKGSLKSHGSNGSNASGRSVRERVEVREDVRAGGAGKSGFI